MDLESLRSPTAFLQTSLPNLPHRDALSEFESWWEQEWYQEPPLVEEMDKAEAKAIFTAGWRSCELPAIVRTWQEVRQEINTPASRAMDQLLGIVP